MPEITGVCIGWARKTILVLAYGVNPRCWLFALVFLSLSKPDCYVRPPTLVKADLSEGTLFLSQRGTRPKTASPITRTRIKTGGEYHRSSFESVRTTEHGRHDKYRVVFDHALRKIFIMCRRASRIVLLAVLVHSLVEIRTLGNGRYVPTDDDLSSTSAALYLLSALRCGCGLVHVVAKLMYFPGGCPRQFFDPGRDFSHTSSMCVLTTTSPIGFCFFCLPAFSLVRIFWIMWTTLPYVFSSRQKKKPPRRSEWRCRTRVKN